MEPLPGQPSYTANQLPLPSSVPPSHLTRNLLILCTSAILLMIFMVLFFFLSARHTQTISSLTTISSVPSSTPSPTLMPPFVSNTQQTIERNPTKKELTVDTYMSLSGETHLQGNQYTGLISSGTNFASRDEDKINQEKLFKQLAANTDAQHSLFLIEARDIQDAPLLSLPISVLSGMDVDVATYSYKQPGSFFEEILVPAHTNSLVLRTRSDTILDRLYVEDWEPEVNVLKYPSHITSSDRFSVDLELLPKGKAYSYTLSLRNATDATKSEVVSVALKPREGMVTEQIDLHQYPFTSSGEWFLEATGYSLFQSKKTTSGPITMQLSSEGIDVHISGKDTTTRHAGDSDYLMWSHIFYGIDVRRGLKELCQKGRCFELIWTGDGVQFNGKNSVTTQVPSLNCTFQGSGRQSIHLRVTENGKIIGEDTYTYMVSGSGSQPTYCQIADM